ncbi:ATP-binding cassette domain-containing protein [Microbispora sp. NBRC 16548]|uniref:ATP-binding cassette domain-containing protein n=1 Tax=Microbispora sp. NBRC 16548 TaxID=3030994 RepID=UPI0024A3B89C|nr:ATP-binding cassette domain-containing protein [Microbispora sp. NBRC 16548]GLX04888.1 hypothetical protein Misp03_18150 [Microbispora sp. NBRC 16548]
MDDTDLRLLRLVATGDDHAFEQLYTRHAHALLAYAEGLLRDRGAAEEALQEPSSPSGAPPDPTNAAPPSRTRLYGICRRQALKRMNGGRPAPLPSTEPDPEVVALARADTAAVAAALTALPATHREVLTLALSAGLSHAEISHILDIPVSTVKSRLFTGVGGHDLTTRSGRLAVQRRLGYLPQDLGLYPDLSAQEFLDYVGLLKGLDDTIARRRQIGELLDMVGLTGAATRKLRGFSGGMRRRVGIAQALLGDPALVVVDEPTAGLDPEERIRFRTLLASIAAGRTVLLSTHIVEDVAQTCRDTAVMARGRVVFNGPVADIAQQAEGVTWELVGQGPPPATGVVVSAISRSDGTHYRLVSPARPHPRAVPVQPSLEEGYVALMHAGASG